MFKKNTVKNFRKKFLKSYSKERNFYMKHHKENYIKILLIFTVVKLVQYEWFHKNENCKSTFICIYKVKFNWFVAEYERTDFTKGWKRD